MARSFRTVISLSLAGALFLASSIGASPIAAQETKQPTAVGTGGAIATVDVLASRAGLEVLRAGGNAVDAAVAAAAVLGVTEPFSCGIGGGGFMVVYRASDGNVTTIDHRETAPSAMRPDSFWEGGAPLTFTQARWSGLSAGVPGTVRGWDEALTRFGTMSLDQVLQPAIRVARDGFQVDQVFSDQVSAVVDFFDDISSTEEVFLDPDGTAPDVGSTFRNPDMALAYERIAHLGVKGFYRGAIADAMVTAVQNPPLTPDANHVWRPGVMTMRDVRAYRAPLRDPTRLSYRELDVYGMGPPSSGGSTVGEALNILEGWDLGSLPREQALHYYLEASAFSFADRNAYLGDSDFVEVPLTGLLSDGFAAERRALITEQASTKPVPAGDPWPFNGGGGAAATAAATAAGGENTTHLTVADRWGNVVTYTYTIESTGGNGITVPGWGFLLNNELTDFNFDLLDHPNSVEGGKRPRSSMSPTIVFADGRPVLALGSPGGSMIITTVLQILLNHFDFGMTLPDAIAAPRASQRNTASVFAEPAFRSAWEAALTARGHAFTTTAEIGAATGIAFLPDGVRVAAAEPSRRGGGSAMVEEPA
ncbi:MAG TPA: gamma-glutamyltransferase [Actinomycetota bacterium]|jgi:gamma-glutamyltranspeptidase/glutathione hydrolase|nr:gamma-glutamyltransferase [Actinomycetota bacterium]